MSEEKNYTIYEAIDYIVSKDTIADGIPMIVFEKLLDLNIDESYQNYILKNIMKNRGLLFREVIEDKKGRREGRLKCIECVKDYYNLNDIIASQKDCSDIINNLANYDTSVMKSDSDCIKCHKLCLSLYKNNQLNKIGK